MTGTETPPPTGLAAQPRLTRRTLLRGLLVAGAAGAAGFAGWDLLSMRGAAGPDVHLPMTLDKSEYALGEKLTITIHNVSDQPFAFANAAYGLYFEVQRNASWEFYTAPVAAQVITSLAPNSEAVVSYTLGTDARFAPGHYRAVVVGSPREAEVQVRTSQEFTVVPTAWLVWQRTGGILGLHEELKVDTDGRARYESSHFGEVELRLGEEGQEQLQARLEEAQFFALASSYPPRANAADYFSYELTVHPAPGPKTVAWVDEWAALNALPPGLIALQRAIEAVVERARKAASGSLDEVDPAVEIARRFLTQAATFRFDGMPETLQVTDVKILESFPVQYVITIAFDSRHAGYGDRTGLAVAQVITPHVAVIKVVSESVVSAVLDDQWDELKQRFIG